jgi:hypothetical protein
MSLDMQYYGYHGGWMQYEDPGDCDMVVFAAYAQEGVYYSYRRVDDSWYMVEGDCYSDAVDVFMDNLSSEEIWAMDPLFAFAGRGPASRSRPLSCRCP